MTVFIKPPAYLPPTHKERNPVTAAIIGFLFGGIGLGLYFKSVIDFLIPVGFAVATAVVAAAASAPSGAGFLGGCMIAARWGYYRARQSNARLATRRLCKSLTRSVHRRHPRRNVSPRCRSRAGKRQVLSVTGPVGFRGRHEPLPAAPESRLAMSAMRFNSATRTIPRCPS